MTPIEQLIVEGFVVSLSLWFTIWGATLIWRVFFRFLGW